MPENSTELESQNDSNWVKTKVTLNLHRDSLPPWYVSVVHGSASSGRLAQTHYLRPCWIRIHILTWSQVIPRCVHSSLRSSAPKTNLLFSAADIRGKWMWLGCVQCASIVFPWNKFLLNQIKWFMKPCGIRLAYDPIGEKCILSWNCLNALWIWVVLENVAECLCIWCTWGLVIRLKYWYRGDFRFPSIFRVETGSWGMSESGEYKASSCNLGVEACTGHL